MQQLGVTLAVGAETILLVAYLQSIRDGVVDDEEKGFARAVRSVKDFGLFFIILSGGAIVANQFFTDQLGNFLSITVLFKWSLIGIALFLGFIRGSSLTAGLLQGLSAGTWFALFAVHILAPEAPWMQLVTFYAIWLVGFSVCWTVLVFALKGKKSSYVATAHLPAEKQIKASAVSKAAVVITPDRVTVKPSQKSVVAEPAHVSDKLVSAPFVPPVTVSMPKQNPAAEPKTDAEGSAQAKPLVPIPSIPKPPTPPPAPVAAAMPPPPPVPPPKVVPGPVAPPPASWLHVMPKTPEDLAKRKEQSA